ncbi:MAG: HPr family phosphocarrier protein [Lachnospiraceae bacterium]|jgi:phosphocarrier protein HPr|nr:HPr family phosphocarrier protein [Lachnospiraceae bacterium]GFI16577.1 phosphocarrier protein HPr [Lachnospiraceae bacterium]
MKTFDYTINDALGIHARPAGQLAKLVASFGSKITIAKEGGADVSAKSIMSLMGLGATKGTNITVKVEGPDEDAAAKAVEDFLKANL